MEQPSTVSYSELLLCVCTSLRVGLVGQAVGLWATEQVLGKFLILRGPRGASEGRLFLFQEGLEWLPYSVVSVESSEQASGGGGIFGPRQSSSWRLLWSAVSQVQVKVKFKKFKLQEYIGGGGLRYKGKEESCCCITAVYQLCVSAVHQLTPADSDPLLT